MKSLLRAQGFTLLALGTKSRSNEEVRANIGESVSYASSPWTWMSVLECYAEVSVKPVWRTLSQNAFVL